MHPLPERDGHAVNGSVTVECIDDPARLATIAAEWELLSERQSPWLPFLGPTWSLLWWRHFAEQGPFVRDRLCARAIRSADGALIAVAPLMLTERPATGPLRLRLLQFVGADPSITEARGLVCDPAHEAIACGALLTDVRRHSPHWDFMHWRGVAATSGTREVVGRSADVQWTEGNSAFVLELPSSWAEFRSRLPRNTKESLRKCYNSLKRAGVAFEFRVFERGSELAYALEDFYALHAERARRADTVAHSDVFGASVSRAFLRDFVDQSRAGSVLIFQLVVGGEVVATRVGFRSGQRLYLYYSGYAWAWRRYSIMTTLMAETLKWAVGERITSVNLSFGRDVSKTRWRPREVPFYEARWVSASWRGRLLQRTLKGVDELRRHQRFGSMTRSVLRPFGMRAPNAHK
jgi:CelD/BcsL family acetyltransferase involved in cellulose biosynthesis